MRVLWALLICITFYTGNAQCYVKGISSQEIDDLQSDFVDSKLRYDFDGAREKLEILTKYWSGVIREKNPATSERQNFFYCKIQKNYKRFYPEFSNSAFLDSLLSLNKEIQKTLPQDNAIWGLYYSKIASLYSSSSNSEMAKEYYVKAIKVLDIHKDRLDDKLWVQLRLASLELKLGNKEKALQMYNVVVEEREQMQPVDSIALAYAYYDLGRYYERIADYKTNAFYWDAASDIIYNHYGQENKFYWFIQRARGLNFNNNSEYEKALNTFLFLDQKLSNSSDDIFVIGNNQKLIANCYIKLNELDKASGMLKAIIESYTSHNQTAGLTSIYNDLSLVTKSYVEKIDLLNKAIANCKEDKYCDPQNEAIAYKNLAIEYRKSGDIIKGLNYLEKALEIELTHKDKYSMKSSYTYNALSTVYDELGNDTGALQYAIKALEAHQGESKNDLQRTAFLQSNLAYFYIKDNQVEKAENLLAKAINNIDKVPAATYDNKANVYSQLSYLHKVNQDYSTSMFFNNKSLKAYATWKGKRSEFYSRRLNQKAAIFLKLGEPDSSRIVLKQGYQNVGLGEIENKVINTSEIPQDYLWLAFKTLNDNMEIETELDSLQVSAVLANKIKTGCYLIDDLRRSHYFEVSEQNFIKSTAAFLNRSIDLLYFSYNRNPNENILALIFKCIEKSKSIAINRAFERSQMIMEKGVPLDLVKKEKQTISTYEQSFKKYTDLNEEGNLEQASRESKIMFSLQEQKDHFLDSLRRTYPEYYKRRYSQNLIDLKAMEQIAKEQNRGFLQYHWTEKELYKFFILPNRTVVSKLENKEILNLLDSLNTALIYGSANKNEKKFTHNLDLFKRYSHLVYGKVIGNSISDNLPFNITIIPDGKLNGLSFDVLLEHDSFRNISYSSLPYLIKKHSISYVGSASQFAILQDFRISNNGSNYVGFAPSYKGDHQENRSIATSNLLYNVREVELASVYFKGDQFLGEEATETRFKDLISDYNIAHLALHGIVNDSFPLNSYLQFVPEDSIHDGRLYLHEIIELEITNGLMVLSACETNNGEEIKGEGLLGISRAFQIASCPNILVSNWLVDDKSASQLMQPFFQEIASGESPAYALRTAKLDFLNSSALVNTHPSYWASFSFHGNPNYVFTSQTLGTKNVIYLITALVIFLLLYFVQKKF